jgi:hypothetical protein
VTLGSVGRFPGGARRAGLLRLVTAIWVSGGGCVLATPPVTTPPPESLPVLEAAVSDDPTNVPAAIELALGYVASDRFEDARLLLATTHDQVPADRTVLAVLGMAEHRLGLAAEANLRFDSFLEAHPNDPVASEVRVRRDANRSMALLAEARTRLAQPTSLDEGVGGDRLAVLPFRVRGGDATGAYLATALAELMSSRLSLTLRNVVDSREVRALLEAMAAAPDETLTLGAAARLGASLAAGRVVFGVLDLSVPGRVTLEATLIERGREGLSVTAFAVGGLLVDAASLERRLAILVLEAVNGDVGADMAGAFGRGDWPETAALIDFGEGLTREARGDLAGAVGALERALASGAGFEAAGERLERTRRAIEAVEAPLLPTLVEAARVGELQRSVVALRSRAGSSGETAARRVGARDRVGVAELLGLDRLGWGTPYEILFTLPTGAP